MKDTLTWYESFKLKSFTRKDEHFYCECLIKKKNNKHYGKDE